MDHDALRGLLSQARCGDQRAAAEGDKALCAALDTALGPAKIVADRDLLERIFSRLEPVVCELVEFRAQRRTWAEIPSERGRHPDAVRKQFDRAVDQAVAFLGLQEYQE